MSADDGRHDHALLSRLGSTVVLLKVAGAGSSFVMYVVLARALGVVEYGFFVYALTWVNVMLLLGKAGTDVAVVRFLPAHVEQGDWPRARGVLKFAHALVGFGTVLLAATGFFAAHMGAFNVGGAKAAFAVGLLSVPLLGLAALRQGALRALRAFVRAEIPDGLLRPWLLVLSVALLWLIAGQVSAVEAMGCYLLANLLTLAVGTVWLMKAVPKDVSAAAPVYDVRTWAAVSLQLMLHTGIFQILNQIDILMLGALAHAEDVARYSAASRMAWFTAFGSIALGSVAAPLISAGIARGDMQELQKVLRSGTRRGFAFALVVSSVFAAFGSFILTLFGRDFTSAYPALIVLVAGQLVNAFWGLGSQVMIMMARQRQLVSVMVGAVALNALLNWLLIPAWGIDGAAAATAITTVAWSAIVSLYCLKALHVKAAAV